MHQIFWLIRYDLRQLRRERGFVLLLALALLLALWGLFQGAGFQADAARATQAAATRQADARLAAQDLARRYFAAPDAAEFAGMKWWRSPVDIRGYAFYEHVGFALKPALPGAALAVGQADVLPSVVRVKAETLEAARNAYDIEHPARLAVGRFDLMFFLVYLWPLLLLALGASVLTQERESRRLPALRLQGLSPRRLLLAQTLARTLLATLLLGGGVAAAALLGAALPPDAAGALALAQWAGLLLLWSLFWGAVSALICSVCQSRMTAAFAGFGAWVGLTILLPALLVAGVNTAVPLPSRELYVEAMRDAGDQLQAQRSQMLMRFYDEHPQWRPTKTGLDKISSSVARIPRMLELERLLAPVEQGFDAARAGREALFARWLWLSPASLASEGFARLAGNDAARHRLFEQELQAHHTVLRQFFHERIQQAALRDEQSACAQTCLAGYGFSAFDAVPSFVPSAGLERTQHLSAWPLPAWAGLLLAAALLTLRERRLNARQELETTAPKV
ncbi:ABC-2 type transport system permease protein [Paucibacter oligotrophus]|uniref:ABC-2 type transport system permease protein n=1 Tax=Roseateles oligotrophus TaxID=1769250 RepID=A0A840LBY4_9BURK|nr:DUF3526 domain-containing protein [Roseateles oligotrophus]MBB4844162.1 ABC-2 type transport system permease protein [Roseateles oligotrophus]